MEGGSGGKSGKGKSLILKHILGLIKADSGTVRVFGKDLDTIGKRELKNIRSHFGVLFQNAALFDSMTVFDNVALPLRERTKLPEDEIRTVVNEKLRLMDVEGSNEKYPAQLSGGMKKRVGLARAIVLNPKIIFFDEPTSYLDPPARREFLQHSVFAKEDHTGTTILVTQYWEETADCDRLLILEAGRIIYDGLPSDYTPSEEPPTARFHDLDEKWLKAVAIEKTDPLIKVEDLCQTASIFAGELSQPLRDINFSIRSGELVGLVGPTGAGKSTLAYHLAGLMPKFSGRITIAGHTVTARARQDEHPPVALLFQNPDQHLFAETVTQDVAFGPRNLGFPKAEIQSHVVRSLEVAGLPAAEFGPRSPFEISGGEQRKAALAGTLALPAALYIFDEPSAYLDRASTAYVELLIKALAKAGKNVIVISHDLPFLRRTCPRWLILHQGKLTYDGSLTELDRDREPLREIGFDSGL